MLAPSHPLHLQRLDWARDHVMTLPPQLRAGMVAWTLVNGTASPACILDLESVNEDGAYAPFVRVSAPTGWRCILRLPACTLEVVHSSLLPVCCACCAGPWHCRQRRHCKPPRQVSQPASQPA